MCVGGRGVNSSIQKRPQNKSGDDILADSSWTSRSRTWERRRHRVCVQSVSWLSYTHTPSAQPRGELYINYAGWSVSLAVNHRVTVCQLSTVWSWAGATWTGTVWTRCTCTAMPPPPRSHAPSLRNWASLKVKEPSQDISERRDLMECDWFYTDFSFVQVLIHHLDHCLDTERTQRRQSLLIEGQFNEPDPSLLLNSIKSPSAYNLLHTGECKKCNSVMCLWTVQYSAV